MLQLYAHRLLRVERARECVKFASFYMYMSVNDGKRRVDGGFHSIRMKGESYCKTTVRMHGVKDRTCDREIQCETSAIEE